MMHDATIPTVTVKPLSYSEAVSYLDQRGMNAEEQEWFCNTMLPRVLQSGNCKKILLTLNLVCIEDVEHSVHGSDAGMRHGSSTTVGEIVFRNGLEPDGGAEICCHSLVQGKGYMAAGVQQLLEYVPAKYVYAKINCNNVASIKMVEKCGFEWVREDEWRIYLPKHEQQLITL